VQVLKSAGRLDGKIFISPYGSGSSYANGPEIVDGTGRVVWFQAVPVGQEAADFRAQTLYGKPVLTWWQGTGLGAPEADGVDYIYDEHYKKIGEIRAKNGYSTDGHEFRITARNTALILSYHTIRADLRALGGAADQAVSEGVVQEIDIRTGKLLFQWNSTAHVPYSESKVALPASADTPWDYFHVNAVRPDTDGDLLVDARNTWTTYKVDRRTGKIIWRLGGKRSTFRLTAADGQSLDAAGSIFAFQHDPEPVGPDTYTVFDNEAAVGGPLLDHSRVVTIRLNRRTKTATLVKSLDQPEGLVAASQGNAQTTRSGDVFVGWGALPYISAFGRDGGLKFDARFPTGVNTYRAYLLPWR
jgi:hypothetical protein